MHSNVSLMKNDHDNKITHVTTLIYFTSDSQVVLLQENRHKVSNYRSVKITAHQDSC